MEVILCTAGYDRTIRFWEALSGICSRTIQHPDSQVNRLSISPDKRYVAAAGNPNTRIYEALGNNPNVVYSLEGHSSNVTGVQFQQNNKWVVCCSEDNTIKIWDMRSKGPQREYSLKCPVNDVIIHPNQAELISCDQNGSIRVWDLTANACSHELMPEDDAPMRSVSMTSDGKYLVGGNNRGNVYFWRINADEFEPVFKLEAHEKYLLKSIVSSDGKRIATCSADQTAKIWKVGEKSAELEKTLNGHQRWVWDCAFSADGEYLVTASSDHTSRLWDLSRGETIRQYQGHHKAAVCVALNDVGN